MIIKAKYLRAGVKIKPAVFYEWVDSRIETDYLTVQNIKYFDTNKYTACPKQNSLYIEISFKEFEKAAITAIYECEQIVTIL